MVLEYKQIELGQGHAAGRELLAKMYRAYTGKEMPQIRITDRGKPYFPEGCLHFSISHTKNYVFCILTKLQYCDKINKNGGKCVFSRRFHLFLS